MRPLVFVGIVLLLPAALQAQGYKLTMTITNPAGNTVYTTSMEFPTEVKDKWLGAVNLAAKQVGLKVPNPAFDDQQPESESNPSQIDATGPEAFAMLFRRWFKDLYLAYVPVLRVKQVAEEEAASAKTELDNITIE